MDIEKELISLGKDMRDIGFLPNTVKDAILIVIIFKDGDSDRPLMPLLKNYGFSFIVDETEENLKLHVEVENYGFTIASTIKSGVYPFTQWMLDNRGFLITHGLWEGGVVGKARAFTATAVEVSDLQYK